MTSKPKQARKLIEGRAALIVIDIQKSTFIDDSEVRSIDNMPGYKDRMSAARGLVDAAHDAHTSDLHSGSSAPRSDRLRP
ncbi:hypothetical protein [Marivita sp.]|jgi:hypothetical protein|uniref:hypothetical protein n=1 Tax=Marivita sp. TaxID=2003365 RepID=UPI00321A60FC